MCGGQELGLVVLAADDVGADGLLGVTSALGGGLAGSLGGLLLQLVPLHAVQEVGSGKSRKAAIKQLNSGKFERLSD